MVTESAVLLLPGICIHRSNSYVWNFHRVPCTYKMRLLKLHPKELGIPEEFRVLSQLFMWARSSRYLRSQILCFGLREGGADRAGREGRELEVSHLFPFPCPLHMPSTVYFTQTIHTPIYICLRKPWRPFQSLTPSSSRWHLMHFIDLHMSVY